MLVNLKNKNLLIILLFILVIVSCLCFSSMKKEGFTNGDSESEFSKYFKDITSDANSKIKKYLEGSEILDNINFDDYSVYLFEFNESNLDNIDILNNLSSKKIKVDDSTTLTSYLKDFIEHIYKSYNMSLSVKKKTTIIYQYQLTSDLNINLSNNNSEANKLQLILFVKGNKIYDTNLEDNTMLKDLSITIDDKKIIKNGKIVSSSSKEIAHTHEHTHADDYLNSLNKAAAAEAEAEAEADAEDEAEDEAEESETNNCKEEEEEKACDELENEEEDEEIIENKCKNKSKGKGKGKGKDKNGDGTYKNKIDAHIYHTHKHIYDTKNPYSDYKKNKNIKNNILTNDNVNHNPPHYSYFEAKMNEPTNPIVNPIKNINKNSESIFEPCMTPSMCKNTFLNSNIDNVNEINNPEHNANQITQYPKMNNPEMQNPQRQDPQMQNPQMQNPQMQNPQMQNPQMQNPENNRSADFSNFPNLMASTDTNNIPKPILNDFSKFGM